MVPCLVSNTLPVAILKSKASKYILDYSLHPGSFRFPSLNKLSFLKAYMKSRELS